MEIGENIHGYRVVELLNKGGFCDAFIVKKGSTQYFMKKYSDPTELSSDFKQFLNNQRLMIPRLKSLGEKTETIVEDFVEGGFYYQVKELIPGKKNLSEWLTEDLDFAHRKDVAIQFCDILDAVHRQNIVHQDLKPEQVMTVPDGSRPSRIRIILTDFDWSVPDGKLVRPVGTPWYINVDKKLSPASDIFTFGIILCEILTGVNPYTKKTGSSYRLYDELEWEKWVNNKDYQRPKNLNDDPKEITPQIDEVIVRCLDPSPSKRPTIKEIKDALMGAVVSPPKTLKLVSESAEKLLAVPGGSYGRRHFKEIFKKAVDLAGNPIYKYLDHDYATLLVSQEGDQLMIASPAYGHAKNKIVLNAKDVTTTPVLVKNGDNLGIFSTAQGKIIYNFVIQC